MRSTNSVDEFGREIRSTNLVDDSCTIFLLCLNFLLFFFLMLQHIVAQDIEISLNVKILRNWDKSEVFGHIKGLQWP